MIQLRVHSPCTLLFPNRLRDSVCHLTAETNVGQVFLRSGQLSVVNLDPDTLVDLFSIIVNKIVYKTSVKDIWQNGADSSELQATSNTKKTEFIITDFSCYRSTLYKLVEKKRTCAKDFTRFGKRQNEIWMIEKGSPQDHYDGAETASIGIVHVRRSGVDNWPHKKKRRNRRGGKMSL